MSGEILFGLFIIGFERFFENVPEIGRGFCRYGSLGGRARKRRSTHVEGMSQGGEKRQSANAQHLAVESHRMLNLADRRSKYHNYGNTRDLHQSEGPGPSDIEERQIFALVYVCETT